MDTPYGVSMRVRVKAERREEFIALIRQLAHDVRANEPGTLVFECMQNEADPLEFVFAERFRDREAWKAHQNAPYHLEMAPKGWACLDGDPIIEPMLPITP